MTTTVHHLRQTSPPHVTPWGPTETRDELEPGVWLITTASHGGLWLDVARRSEIPGALRDAAHIPGGIWFEEDCDLPAALYALGINTDDRCRDAVAFWMPRAVCDVLGVEPHERNPRIIREEKTQ